MFNIQGGQVTDELLKSQIYEQWIDANLQEMESQCLPRHLAQERHKVLSGRYGLQV